MKHLIPVACFCFLLGCGIGGEDATQIFRMNIQDPVPSTVSQLKGKSSQLGGYSANLTFVVDQNTFVDLAAGYKAIAHSDAIVRGMDLLSQNVKENPDLYCYYRSEDVDGKKKEYYLFWDEKTNQAHFVANVY